MQGRIVDDLRRDGIATVAFAELFDQPALWSALTDDIGGFVSATESRLPGMSVEDREEEFGKTFLVRRFRVGRSGRGHHEVGPDIPGSGTGPRPSSRDRERLSRAQLSSRISTTGTRSPTRPRPSGSRPSSGTGTAGRTTSSRSSRTSPTSTRARGRSSTSAAARPAASTDRSGPGRTRGVPAAGRVRGGDRPGRLPVARPARRERSSSATRRLPPRRLRPHEPAHPVVPHVHLARSGRQAVAQVTVDWSSGDGDLSPDSRFALE